VESDSAAFYHDGLTSFDVARGFYGNIADFHFAFLALLSCQTPCFEQAYSPHPFVNSDFLFHAVIAR
jgi:hypothetical protein